VWRPRPHAFRIFEICSTIAGAAAAVLSKINNTAAGVGG
jgi:hypothetical protein